MLHTLISKSSNAKPFLLYASSFLPGAKELANASMPLSYACQFGMLFDIMIRSLFDDSYSALYSSYAKKRLNCVLTLLISRLLRLTYGLRCSLPFCRTLSPPEQLLAALRLKHTSSNTRSLRARMIHGSMSILDQREVSAFPRLAGGHVWQHS